MYLLSKDGLFETKKHRDCAVSRGGFTAKARLRIATFGSSPSHIVLLLDRRQSVGCIISYRGQHHADRRT